jgi:hypothetical protein
MLRGEPYTASGVVNYHIRAVRSKQQHTAAKNAPSEAAKKKSYDFPAVGTEQPLDLGFRQPQPQAVKFHEHL